MLQKVFESTDLSMGLLPVGELGTNCYLAVSGQTAAIVDPGGDCERIVDALDSGGLSLQMILLTHAHADHTGAAGPLKERYPEARLHLHEAEAGWPGRTSHTLSYWLADVSPCPEADVLVKEGDELALNGVVFRVMHLPGHTPGCVGYYLEGQGVLLGGDVLFAGSIGRTDLPGSASGRMMDSLERLGTLPDATIVFPGHGPQTTIGREKKENPFLSGELRL